MDVSEAEKIILYSSSNQEELAEVIEEISGLEYQSYHGVEWGQTGTKAEMIYNDKFTEEVGTGLKDVLKEFTDKKEFERVENALSD